MATGTDGRKVATPWGPASVVDRVELQQRAGEERFSTYVELLEVPDRGRFVRFAYSRDGVARRGPVTLQSKDVSKLLSLLPKHPELAAALRLRGDA
jgi:hypothetical protein